MCVKWAKFKETKVNHITAKSEINLKKIQRDDGRESLKLIVMGSEWVHLSSF